MTKIIAVHKEQGEIKQFKLNDGQIVDYDTAVAMTENGQIENVDVFERFNRKIIRSEPDGDKSNNLDSLPKF